MMELVWLVEWVTGLVVPLMVLVCLWVSLEMVLDTRAAREYTFVARAGERKREGRTGAKKEPADGGFIAF